MNIDLSLVFSIILLIGLLSFIVGSLIDIFIFKLDIDDDYEDVNLHKFIEEYKEKRNPKKKG